MNKKQRIITDNNTLREQYHLLGPGDVVITRVRLSPSEEHIYLDLVDRGVVLFPHAVAQQASRSKTFQTLLLSEFMLPHTLAVHDHHGLIKAMNTYQKNSIGRVVTKLDRANAGIGIHLWNSTEEIYSMASLGSLPFPFVMQPFEPHCRDIRIIILGNYMESYWRSNPHNFRNNLHCGGSSESCELTPEQLAICEKVMKRGRFPYAHIDLMVTPDEVSFLAEINLRGGIRGAKIAPEDYRKKIQDIHEETKVKFMK